jgi:8-oxo-dGTP pyrophosphatase MutT (NUDIX family)
MRTTREHSAGGVVVAVRDGRAHVAAIRPHGRPEGHWTLPKGGLDPGETALQAALREVREETGLSCEAGEALPPIRYFYVRGGVRVAKLVELWLMTPVSGTIDALEPAMRREVAEARWLPLEEAGRLLAYAGERAAVAEVAPGRAAGA